MPLFICVKPTAFRGRQQVVGTRMQASEKKAELFRDHPCWREELEPADPVTNEDLSDAGKKAKKEGEEAREALREQERLKILKELQDMGLKPNARTGIPKLTKMLADAKAAAGGSII